VSTVVGVVYIVECRVIHRQLADQGMSEAVEAIEAVLSLGVSQYR
jgi:hypothetical protein